MLPAFDARRIWSTMAEGTVLMAVPTMYKKLFEAFDAADPGVRAGWEGVGRGQASPRDERECRAPCDAR